MPATLAQAVLGPLADVAAEEELKKCIVVADDGSIEALRWSGGITFLMNTVQVQTILSLDDAVAAVCRSDDDVSGPTAHELFDPWMNNVKNKILLFTSRSLVELEAVLAALLHADVASTFVVASTLPERAFGPSFSFETFRQTLLRGAPVDSLRIRYVPLLYAPLLEFEPRGDITHPGLFVLVHPKCAPVFPLMRCQLHGLQHDGSSKAWSHAQDISPQDIPETTRKAFKTLAQVLGAIMVQWQLEVKSRIFALGATSLKIGHTLQAFLHDLQEECTIQEVKEYKPATLILIDRFQSLPGGGYLVELMSIFPTRTCDLATPSTQQHTLLDRILEHLPAATRSTPADSNAEHITEVGPLFATPSPVPTATPRDLHHRPSSLLSTVKWTGGISLCHAYGGPSQRVFESLAIKAPIAALKHLDKELRDVAMDLLKQKLTPVPEKKDAHRGRDVILRWVQCIADCTDANVTWQHQDLLQIAIAVLETLERMEASTEQTKRLTALEKHIGACSPDAGVHELIQALHASQVTDVASILSLCIFVCALSGTQTWLDAQTTSGLHEAIKAALLRNPTHPLLPPGMISPQASADHATEREQAADDDNWDDWGDDDVAPPPSNDSSGRAVASSELEVFVGSLCEALRECGQLYKPLPGHRDVPGVLGRLMALLIDPSVPTIPKLEHVTDASEQLTKAGMDLLKSGLSVFGFGSTPQPSGAAAAVTSAHCKLHDTVVLFVVGGITMHEVQAISDVVKSRPDLRVLVGSTTITSPSKIQQHVVWNNHCK
ncbi:hypothetical protein H310_12023 [Aphanomyces invadans]|uniref:Sec1 family domain-containing protein 2 n=1 Tax=Aphanomyces invadans TaxID=157072 RepID=A0A024TK45_9STRA|nr:hypothetical protein H310_12023 [Aphanomyces invadans]ETV94388.1 hypothetical protein H310_12023 [Aphanomyces invadans]|eukprot:XP_008877150.1 hypothetical protein H310_12023 [Aphanomyces invadans]